MQDIVINCGFGIIFLGIFIRLFFTIVYGYKSHKAKDDPDLKKCVRSKWMMQHRIGYVVCIVGIVVTIFGTMMS